MPICNVGQSKHAGHRELSFNVRQSSNLFLFFCAGRPHPFRMHTNIFFFISIRIIDEPASIHSHNFSFFFHLKSHTHLSNDININIKLSDAFICPRDYWSGGQNILPLSVRHTKHAQFVRLTPPTVFKLDFYIL